MKAAQYDCPPLPVSRRVEMPVAKFFLTHEALAPVEVHFGIHAMAGSGVSASRYT